MPNTRTFTGATGDLSATAAWSDATVPIAGDSAILNDYAQNVTASMGNIALALLDIRPRYTGSIVATPTSGTVTSMVMRFGGAYARFGMSVTEGLIEVARAAQIYLDGGTWGGTQLRVASGTIICAALAVLDDIRNGDANWTIYPNATRITSFHNSRGNITTEGRNVGQYIGMGGQLTLRTTSAIADGSTTGYAFVGPNATIALEGTATAHDTIHLFGTLDVRHCKVDPTVTTVIRYPGHRILGQERLIITNDIEVGSQTGAGGSFSGFGGAVASF